MGYDLYIFKEHKNSFHECCHNTITGRLPFNEFYGCSHDISMVSLFLSASTNQPKIYDLLQLS